MKGCRPLTKEEIQSVLQSFGGTYANRDRALFSLGIVTGFRISELLSLKIRDVTDHRGISDYVTVHKANTKGKTESRTKAIPGRTKDHLNEWITDLNPESPESYLFQSRQGGNRPISRVQAHRILKEAMNDLSGKVATHTMRKTSANNVYDYMIDQATKGKRIDPLRQVQKHLGHKSASSTEAYLSFKAEPVPESIFF